MLKISSTVEYATRIMVRLSRLAEGETMNAECLAASENIPRGYVDQVLQRVRRAGLITSRRGAQGGYCLARGADQISVGNILKSVDHAIFESVCEKFSAGEQQCAHTDACGIRPVWARLSVLVEDFLDRVPLSELANDEKIVTDRISLFLDLSKDAAGHGPAH